jgi:hypothetical protein
MKNKLFGLTSLLFGLIAIATFIYVSFFIKSSEHAFGENWINNEITFIRIPKYTLFNPEYDLIFQMKPITIFIVSCFIWWIFGAETLRPYLQKFPYQIKKFLFLVSVVFIFINFFELAFNLELLNSKITVGLLSKEKVADTALADRIFRTDSYYPVNLTFAIKGFTAIFFISLYSAWFLDGLVKEKERHSE